MKTGLVLSHRGLGGRGKPQPSCDRVQRIDNRTLSRGMNTLGRRKKDIKRWSARKSPRFAAGGERDRGGTRSSEEPEFSRKGRSAVPGARAVKGKQGKRGGM